MFFDRRTEFIKTRLFDLINTAYRLINCVFRSKNTVYQKKKKKKKTLLLNLINTVYRPINSVFLLNNIVFSAINRLYQRQMYNISKNYVFCNKLCFSSEKLCVSIEKYCLLPINSVFRFITHLACHTLNQFYNEKIDIHRQSDNVIQ